jgi:hypothetical protein
MGIGVFSEGKNTSEHRLRYIMEGNVMKERNSPFVLSMIAIIGIFLLPMASDKTNAAEQHKTAKSETGGIHQMEGWFALEFDPRIHTKAKLPRELQSNKINPYVRSPQSQLQSFQSSIDNDFRPGVEYHTGGKPVRAVAGGIVHFVGELPSWAGRAGGFYVRVAHDFYDGLKKDHYPRATLYRNQVYRSSYYYLSKVVVEHWQTVKRGQIIGYGSSYGTNNKQKAKIVLEERGNWVNPDDYGQKHGFMTYWDGETNLEIDLEEMNCQLDKQIEIVRKLIVTLKVKFYGAVYRAHYNHLLASNPHLRSEFAGRRRSRIRSAIDRRGRSTCEPCRTDPRCLPIYRGYRIELRLRVRDAASIQKTFPS